MPGSARQCAAGRARRARSQPGTISAVRCRCCDRNDPQATYAAEQGQQPALFAIECMLHTARRPFRPAADPVHCWPGRRARSQAGTISAVRCWCCDRNDPQATYAAPPATWHAAATAPPLHFCTSELQSRPHSPPACLCPRRPPNPELLSAWHLATHPSRTTTTQRPPARHPPAAGPTRRALAPPRRRSRPSSSGW